MNGKGVLAGLTNISDVRANKIVDGVQIPTHGRLFYRGYDVKDLVEGFAEDSNFGYEEATYLLLFNKLPDAKELEMFKSLLAGYRSLPTSFVRDIIMKAPSYRRRVPYAEQERYRGSLPQAACKYCRGAGYVKYSRNCSTNTLLIMPDSFTVSAMPFTPSPTREPLSLNPSLNSYRKKRDCMKNSLSTLS